MNQTAIEQPSTQETTVHETPIHDFHVTHGAKMVDFAGWEMPISYGSIINEHNQVRSSGGIFDVSHMGRVNVKGRHARRFLEKLCTRRVSDMKDGQCRYSLICNEQGGVKDDVLIYRKDDDEFLLVVNASNREKLLPHFEEVRGDLTCKIDDVTMKTAMVALQGPKVMDIISNFSSEIPTLKRYRFVEKNMLVLKVLVSRTGYTGEDGVEVILPAKMAKSALGMLMKDVDIESENAAIKPAGLGARDSLRLEAGMALYGHELTEERCALECNVDFAINMDKDQDERGEAFVGLDALRIAERDGLKKTITGLILDGKRTARQGMPVLKGDKNVGEITSACLSPTLGKPIAIAYLDIDAAEPGGALSVDTGKSKVDAEVTKPPFYKAGK